jgi:hypothetical protein
MALEPTRKALPGFVMDAMRAGRRFLEGAPRPPEAHGAGVSSLKLRAADTRG